jgi:hypothetical protein
LFFLSDLERKVANQFIQASIDTKMRSFDMSIDKCCVESKKEAYRILVYNKQIYEYNNCQMHLEGLPDKMDAFFKYNPKWTEVEDPNLIVLLKSKKPKVFSGYLYRIKAPRIFHENTL